MSKELLFGIDARKKMMVGVEAVARLVGSTLGPKGRCVVVERIVSNPATKEVVGLSPVTTKDGVSVARAISLPDPTENLGCDLIREAALRTVSEAGDGTTASIVLAHSLISNGMIAIENGASPVFLRSGIDKTVAQVVKLISQMAIPSEGKEAQIANIAANGDAEIGNIVIEAVGKAGKNGIVSVDSSRTNQTHIEFSAGMRFDSGLRYPDFVTDGAHNECVLEKPYILLHERRIQNIKTIEKLLTSVAQSGRSILILSEEFEIPVVGLLIANIAMLRSCPVVAPWFGERRRDFMKDLAIFTKGVSITDELGIDLKNVGLEILGEADRVVVTKNHTTIIGGHGDKVELARRVKSIKSALKATENQYEQEVLAERLAKLDGGVAVIKIGAATESESKEKRDRTEDAVLSVKCAQEEGVVPGGGIALLRCSESPMLHEFISTLNEEERIGAALVLTALEAPIRQILANGGYDTNEVLSQPSFWRTVNGGVRNKDRNYGFNALTGEYVDMLEAGVIDPAKVVRQAITNAASLAGTMLTASGTIVNLREGAHK